MLLNQSVALLRSLDDGRQLVSASTNLNWQFINENDKHLMRRGCVELKILVVSSINLVLSQQPANDKVINVHNVHDTTLVDVNIHETSL